MKRLKLLTVWILLTFRSIPPSITSALFFYSFQFFLKCSSLFYRSLFCPLLSRGGSRPREHRKSGVAGPGHQTADQSDGAEHDDHADQGQSPERDRRRGHCQPNVSAHHQGQGAPRQSQGRKVSRGEGNLLPQSIRRSRRGRRMETQPLRFTGILLQTSNSNI